MDSKETFAAFALIGGAGEMGWPRERVWHVQVTLAVSFLGSILGFVGRAAALRFAAGLAGLAASCVLLLPAFFPGSFYVPYFVAGSDALLLGFLLVITDGLIGILSACPKGFWQFRHKRRHRRGYRGPVGLCRARSLAAIFTWRSHAARPA